MAGVIEFWFDFSSPYAYFAAAEVDTLERDVGRAVAWQPFLLGVVFERTGMRALAEIPLRGDYARRDWERVARLLGVPFTLPPRHPITAVAASRAFYSIAAAEPERAPEFARAIFRAYFEAGAAIDDPEIVAEIANGLGLAPETLDGAKGMLRARTEEAIARGIFGSPMFIVDGEPFWGWDRIPMMRDWIQRGGW